MTVLRRAPDAEERPDVTLTMPNFDGGGAERMMTRLARGLGDAGRRVEMVVCSDRGPFRDACGPNVRVVDLGTTSVHRGLLPLALYLRRRRPRSVLATLDHMSLAVLLARELAGVPVRVVVREANHPSGRRRARLKGRLVSATFRRWLRRADAVVAVSEGVAGAVAAWARVPRSKVHAIYNPVVDGELLERAADHVDHPFLTVPGHPVILAAGRLAPQKDFATLLRAFAMLHATRPVRLVLLGEGSERASLEALAHDLGIEEAVSMPGFVDNPFAYMRRAAVFALSSAWEGLPGVLVQAMACGCPIVSTDCPSGPREILDGGRYGALVPVGDAEALASALAATIDDPLDRASLRGRAAAFSVDQAVARYLEVLLPDER
jgi:glycosyltransferase involved in cell wall biosynthesis